jgi:lipopolysaccharide export system permease protein
MITKIDWYIIKRLLITFFFCMVLFLAISIAIDSSEKADDFVKSGLNTWQLITKYFFGFIPWIWGLLFPLFVFIATIYLTSRMASRSEVVAILASGVSYNRFLRPFILGGFILSAVLWYASRSVIPAANKIRGDFQTKYLDRGDPSKGGGPISYMRSDSNTYVGIKNYDTAMKAAYNFFLNRVKDGKIYYNLRADNFKWDTSKKNWKLTNATERIVSENKEKVNQYPEMNLNLNIKPEDLRRDYYLKDKLTTPELAKLIKKEELRGTEGINTLKVELHRRNATPFSVLLLTVIGAVIASRKTRGGSGLHLALGIIIAAIFIIADRFSTTFSIKGDFSPLLAAWLPNIVFTFVAYYLYRIAPK